MSNTKIMPWIDALPEVAATDFQTRRDQIAAMVAEADELKRQAEELTRKADEVRGKAYLESCKLEGAAKGHWSIEVVDRVKARTGW